jgi:hypothetical protein
VEAEGFPWMVNPGGARHILFFNHNVANSGYRVAFARVIVFFLLGPVFVSRIRSVR